MACQTSYTNMNRACNEYTTAAKQFAPDWYLRDRHYKLCDVRYMNNGNGNCVVMGKVNSFLNQLDDQLDLYIQWWAANQPANMCTNSGFCLPYPNETIAYQNTPNMGVVPVKDKRFSFDCPYPSGYYKRLGGKFVKPHIRFRFCDRQNRPVSKIYILQLEDYQLQKKTTAQPNYDQPQYMRLLQQGLQKPSWV